MKTCANPNCDVEFDNELRKYSTKYCTAACRTSYHNREYKSKLVYRERTVRQSRMCWCGRKLPTTKHMLAVGYSSNPVAYWLCEVCAGLETLANERRPLLDN